MSEEKTEQPTPHKLKKAREAGEVPQTKDFVTTFVTVLGFGILLGMGGVFGTNLSAFTQRAAEVGFRGDFTASLTAITADATTLFITILAPFCLAALVAAPLATVIGQGGLVFAKYKLKFDALNPASNLKQRFSKQNLIEFIKALVRFGLIIAVFVYVIREAVPTLLLSVFCTLECASDIARNTGFFFVSVVFGVMFILALIDLLIQRSLWKEKQKMTPDEVKREHKELEGDPAVKSERKAFGRRLTAVTLEEAIDYAAAVFVDGNGRAVAIYHSFERENPAVAVTLGGAGSLAVSLISRANQEGAPIILEPKIVSLTIGLSGMQAVGNPALKEMITKKLLAQGANF